MLRADALGALTVSPPQLQPRHRRASARVPVGCVCATSANGRAAEVPGHLFVFGFGRISGACRGEEKAEALRSQGIGAFEWDPDNDLRLSPEAVDCLSTCTHAIATVPPVCDFDQDPVLVHHGRDLERLAARPTHANPLRWVGYLSSSSVYGDYGGAWVDEEAPLRAEPGSGKPWTRAQAERAWQALHAAHGVPVHTFRLAGIYGPGRSLLDTLSRNRPQSSSQRARGEKAFVSRVHVADIVQVLRASMAAPRPGAIYNVADDNPASRSEVAAFGKVLADGGTLEEARAAAAEEARIESHRAQEIGRHHQGGPAHPPQPGSFLAGGEKRVGNRLIKEELGVRLLFLTYQEGLAAIARGDLSPWPPGGAAEGGAGARGGDGGSGAGAARAEG